jgi:hypothetical protein
MSHLVHAVHALALELDLMGANPARTAIVLEPEDYDRVRAAVSAYDWTVRPGVAPDGHPRLGQVAVERRRPPERRYTYDARLLLHDPERRPTLTRLAGLSDDEQLDLLADLLNLDVSVLRRLT